MVDPNVSDDEKVQRRAWVQSVFDKHDSRANWMENAAVEAGNNALKALLLLNGGACIALLGFLSSTFSDMVDSNTALQSSVTTAWNLLLGFENSSEREKLVTDIVAALSYFAWGAGFSVFGASVAYLTNSCYARGLYAMKRQWEWPFIVETKQSTREWWFGAVLNWVAVGAGVGALLCFSVGVLKVQDFY